MITVENLTKDYILFDKRKPHFLDVLLDRKADYFRALEDVSFTVKAGEVLSIIGENGAGKSTLLKILAGLSYPTKGQVRVDGKISTILEVATGFSPMLSGRKNIRRRLALHGLSKEKIKDCEEDIIYFSELEDVIDNPVYTYSTGMGARLVFSIVTAGIADVLLVDELIVTGDKHFQGKSFRRMRDLCRSGRTVVLVSHAMQYVERLSDRVIWLKNGRVQADGAPIEVTNLYVGKDSDKAEQHSFKKEKTEIVDVQAQYAGGMLSVNTVCKVRDAGGQKLQLQIALHDGRTGHLAGLFNTMNSRIGCLSGNGTYKLNLKFRLPANFRVGNLGLVTYTGDGWHQEEIDDFWGKSNSKAPLLDLSDQVEDSHVIMNKPLEWTCLT